MVLGPPVAYTPLVPDGPFPQGSAREVASSVSWIFKVMMIFENEALFKDRMRVFD